MQDRQSAQDAKSIEQDIQKMRNLVKNLELASKDEDHPFREVFNTQDILFYLKVSRDLLSEFIHKKRLVFKRSVREAYSWT